jgi:hypothetical protein
MKACMEMQLKFLMVKLIEARTLLLNDGDCQPEKKYEDTHHVVG